jgi:hypothetical protein
VDSEKPYRPSSEDAGEAERPRRRPKRDSWGLWRVSVVLLRKLVRPGGVEHTFESLADTCRYPYRLSVAHAFLRFWLGGLCLLVSAQCRRRTSLRRSLHYFDQSFPFAY